MAAKKSKSTSAKGKAKTKPIKSTKPKPIKPQAKSKAKPVAARKSAAKKATAPKTLSASVSMPFALAADCTDADTAIGAVKQCQIDILGHSVSLDTKAGDVLQSGDSLDKYRACVARRAGVANVQCTASTTFRQVADSITCA